MKKPLIDDTGEVRDLDESFFQSARRGRPPKPEDERKQRVNIMLDRDVLEKLKAEGRGWQTRLNATLREALGLR